MQFFGHSESVSCGQFSPDGKVLISASEDTSVRIWDLKNNKNLYTIKGVKFHKSPICALAVAKQKAIFGTGSFDGEIAIVNYESANVNYISNPRSSLP
jgi:WD40 repeat protein